MKRSPFRKPKQVLVFNGAYKLVVMARSVRSASEFSKLNAQAISFACNGKYICAGCFYFRHIDPNIEVEIADLGSLTLQEYDKLCKVERRYFTVRDMARRKRISDSKNNHNNWTNGDTDNNE